MIVLILSILSKFFSKAGSRKQPIRSMTAKLLTELEDSDKGILVNPFLDQDLEREVIFSTLTGLSVKGCKITVVRPYSTNSELKLEEQSEWLLIERCDKC